MSPTEQAETMIREFLAAANERIDDPEVKLDREYIIGYDQWSFSMPAWIGEAYRCVGLYCRVDDELNYFYLTGIFRGDELEILLSCVDTMWTLERNETD